MHTLRRKLCVAVAQKGENGGAVSKTSVNKHRRRVSRMREERE